jgi:hypothetical protein
VCALAVVSGQCGDESPQRFVPAETVVNFWEGVLRQNGMYQIVCAVIGSSLAAAAAAAEETKQCIEEGSGRALKENRGRNGETQK